MGLGFGAVWGLGSVVSGALGVLVFGGNGILVRRAVLLVMLRMTAPPKSTPTPPASSPSLERVPHVCENRLPGSLVAVEIFEIGESDNVDTQAVAH